MKILFAASEAAPYIKTGGLGDVAYALPKALAEAGHEVKIILPLYGVIKENKAVMDSLTFVTDIRTPLSWRNQYTGIYRQGEGHNPEYWFIDNEYYFLRSKGYAIYGDYDDGEKFAFFSRAILETMGALSFLPDVLHCNDWQTAAVPIFLRQFYPQYAAVKTVFTIHNIEYQGKMPLSFAFDVMGLAEDQVNLLSYDGCVNLMKGGIVAADAVTTVSQTYAEEILTPYYAHGLHHILNDCPDKLCGIVNGIDPDIFNPATDPELFMNFNATVAGLKAKARNKLFLQERLGLRPDAEVPLVAMIGRLVGHKGLDLVACVIDEMMDTGIQLVILGTGEKSFEDMARQAAVRYPGRVSANILFDAKLASQIYASADLFLMPSKSEPCGLSQLVAMRYGALPIVRETGGLKDTVPAYNPSNGGGRGFTFVDYNAHEMLRALVRGVTLYREDRKSFEALQKRNMKANFSWSASVKKYERLYKKIKR